MQISRVFAVGAICAFMLTVDAARAQKHQLNGWYPCSEVTLAEAGQRPSEQNAECAVYSAPLCYSGICKAPASVNPTVGIFVKRLPATVGDVTKASNAWLLQGGPGMSSINLEQRMMELHTRLGGAFNVYTMDHRGTGRSTMLDCVAAQGMTTGSPRGRDIKPTEVASCAKDLHIKFGDLAAFSVTSAASDIASFISSYSNGASTFVYGVSYGTILVERLMHLKPVTVKGYILDSIATSAGAPPDKYGKYFSKWDLEYGEVGEHFMEPCGLDSGCKTHFPSANLSTALRDLMTKFDNDQNSTCAALVADGVTNVPPSFMLRSTLGKLLMDSDAQTLIPPVVYRLNRCNANDVQVLTQFVTYLETYSAYDFIQEPDVSSLVYYLTVFSEMWERPTPTQAQIEARFASVSIATADTYDMTELYCAFSKERSAACNEFNAGNYEAAGIIYQRDRYWGKAAILPSDVSVLLLSGKLDPQTPHKYAEYLLQALQTNKKELVAFNYSTHDTVASTPLNDSSDPGLTCGMKVLTSYISNFGDLQRLDKSCVDQMPALNLTVPSYHLRDFFSSDEAYDGAFQAGLSAN